MNPKRLLSRTSNLLLIILLLTSCSSELTSTADPAGVTQSPADVTPTVTASPVDDPPTATESPAATSTIPPTEIATLNPKPRAYISMAYDIESDRVILFGGQLGDYRLASSYNGETWAYDVIVNKWIEMKPSASPGNRSGHALAYDVESDRVILFGGAGGPNPSTWNLNDTWAYDYNTNTWIKMAKGPDNHLGARLAYDTESDRIILFGGYDMIGKIQNDTWAYDFNSDTWTEMMPSSSPPGRNYQAIAYDAKADRVLTWGGTDAVGNPLDANIWSYDFNSNTWQMFDLGMGAHPLIRDYSVMVYDAKADRMILYGGVLLGSGETGHETWAYDYNTNTWSKIDSSTSPFQRSRHSMVYSTAADRVILFGGQIETIDFTYTGETWIFDFNTATWKNVTSQP